MSWWSDEPDDETDFDESDIKIRANPRGSRPRTKIRPRHENAVAGMVLGVDRGRFSVLIESKTDDMANQLHAEDVIVTASRARELGRKSIVTGDHVALVGDTSGAAGSLARIVRIEPRTSLLRRSADDSDTVERAIVANADQMLIVISAANPEPRLRLVDRYLVAAFDAGLTPILCVTKTDLADPAEFLNHFSGLDLATVTSRHDTPPIDQLGQLLAGHITVAVGHSGVGKSTLVNALVPEAARAVGTVNAVTGRGRHTSSSSSCVRVETSFGSGWLVDTPGVRSFGLGHVDPEHLLDAFSDLDAVATHCPRGCTHLPSAPDCAMVEAVRDGTLDQRAATRLDSLQRLLLALRD